MRQIIKTIFIAAPRETVWDFLTDRDKLAIWLNPSETGMVDGEEWRMRSGSVKMWGRVLEAHPPERLVYSFNHEWLNHDTRVCWELAAKDGGTELTLTHDGWEGAPGDVEKSVADHDEGWGGHMERLAKLAAEAAGAA